MNTMITNNLYGSLHLTIEEAKTLLEKNLNIKFAPKDSFYHGEYYRYGKDDAENFLLKKNFDPLDGEPVEMKFPDYSILLYVNHTTRSLELSNLFNKEPFNISLLRQKNS